MRSVFHGVDVRLLDLANWPGVDEEQLSEEPRLSYRRRREAMITLVHTKSVAAAAAVGHLSPKEIRRQFRRCLTVGRDGRIAGFRACQPYYATKPYELADGSGGYAGRLQRLFRQHPKDIERPLIEYALGFSQKLADPPRPTLPEIRGKLLDLSEKAGIGPRAYPRRPGDAAIRTLFDWRASLADTEGRRYNDAFFGRQSAANYDAGREGYRRPMDPHRILVFDEYTIDSFITIPVEQSNGQLQWVPMSRHKSINGRRRGSGDIPASIQALREEPDVAAFLRAVGCAIRPHERRAFSIRGFNYPEGPCFASEIPGGAYIVPDLIELDNAKIHLAGETRSKLTCRLGCIVHYGVVQRAKTRWDIEGWHNVLAAHFRKIKSTTATGPRDPRKRNPEEMAVKLRVEEDHIAQVLELAAARFCRARLPSLKGNTPLEELENWVCNPNTIVRHLPLAVRDTFSLTDKRVLVTISCNLKSGRQPVVRHENADYVGPKLQNMRTRRGRKCILEFDPDHAHIGRLYSIGKKPVEIDVVKTRGIWREPHTLEDRRLYTKLRRQREIPLAGDEGKSPVTLLAEYLAAKAPKDRSAALKLAALRHRASSRGTGAAKAIRSASDSADSTVSVQPMKLKCSGDW